MRRSGPALFAVVFESRDLEQFRAKFARAETHVVAPEELETDGLCAFVFAGAVASDGGIGIVGAILEGEEGGVDLSGSDTAEDEVGGQFGGVVCSQKAVAGRVISCDVAAGDEVLKPGEGMRFASREGVCGFGVCGWRRWVFEDGFGGQGFENGVLHPLERCRYGEWFVLSGNRACVREGW